MVELLKPVRGGFLRPFGCGWFIREFLLNPDNIDRLAERYLARMPYKSQGARFHSFVVYFSTIQRLSWVEATGREEASAFQEYYPAGQPRKYFRLTKAGRETNDADWANPHLALYGSKPIKQASS